MPTFKENYKKKLVPKLKEELKVVNVNMVPALAKVNINIGIGSYLKTSKDFSKLEENLSLITGQKPIVTMSKKSVSNFKLRENTPNGLKVTLRGNQMYEFINKLVNIVLPRVRDFRGLNKKSFDGKGNYSIGFKEHTVFPEAQLDDQLKPFGIQVTIMTTAQDDKSAYELLASLGFPFKKDPVK